MHVTLDRTKCCGSGQCALSAPAVFDHDEEGVAFVVRDRPGSDERAEVAAAVVSCPTGAITVTED